VNTDQVRPTRSAHRATWAGQSYPDIAQPDRHHPIIIEVLKFGLRVRCALYLLHVRFGTLEPIFRFTECQISMIFIAGEDGPCV
jgi:hypothetical protein